MLQIQLQDNELELFTTFFLGRCCLLSLVVADDQEQTIRNGFPSSAHTSRCTACKLSDPGIFHLVRNYTKRFLEVTAMDTGNIQPSEAPLKFLGKLLSPCIGNY
jgi:hypothetical protein